MNITPGVYKRRDGGMAFIASVSSGIARGYMHLNNHIIADSWQACDGKHIGYYQSNQDLMERIEC